MAKKKNNLTFDTLMSFVSSDTQATMSEGNIQQIQLKLLRPDRSQPRQLLPDKLIDDLDQGTGPTDIVLQWIGQAKEDFASPSLLHNIRELKRLADSISQHGLINPVTVRLSEDNSAGHQYTIITGERRFWAYAWLASQKRIIHDGDTKRDPNLIPAIVAPEGVRVRAHQLVENLLREDMNAIEKARGIWALRRELSDNSGKQVTWKTVEQALGVSRQHRSRMVAVLDLPEEAQGIVVQYSLTERAIRPIVQLLRDKPDLQIIAVKHLASLQQNNPDETGEKTNLTIAGRRFVDELLRQPEPAAPEPPPASFYRKVNRSSKLWIDMDDDTRNGLALQIASSENRQQMIDELNTLRDKVVALLQQIELSLET